MFGLTETRYLDSLRVRYPSKDPDHVEHGLCHTSTVHSRMRIGTTARNLQMGIDDPSHAKDDAWVFLPDPSRIGEQDDINVTNCVLQLVSGWPVSQGAVTCLVLPDGRGETSTPRLFLSFDEHHDVDVQLALLSKGCGGTCHG